MSHSNRYRINIDLGAKSLLHPPVQLPGWTDEGLVTVGPDTGRLVRNERTGAYAMHFRGAIRTLDQRKVKGALGLPSNALKLEGGRRVNVYLDAASLERASEIGNGNVSEGIRLALMRAGALSAD